MRGLTFGLLVTAGALLDQLGKYWAHTSIRPRMIVPVWEGFFELRYSLNTGAFFSFGSNLPDAFRRAFFIVAPTLALGLIVAVYRQTRITQRRQAWALCLLASGAVGNLIDRIRSGAVIDFLHLHYGEVFHWATFNIADIWIAAGLTLLILDMLWPQGEAAPASSSEAPEASGAVRQ